MRLLNACIVLSIGLFASVSAAPLAAAADTSVSVVYGGKTTVFSAADLAKLPQRQVSQFDKYDGKNHVYAGALVADLLTSAGMHSGEKFRGRDLRQVVLVHCRDRYEVVFALADFNPSFGDRTIILADSRDGQPLPGAIGPYRLVVSGDKRPARSAHSVTSFEVLSVGDSTGR